MSQYIFSFKRVGAMLIIDDEYQKGAVSTLKAITAQPCQWEFKERQSTSSRGRTN